MLSRRELFSDLGKSFLAQARQLGRALLPLASEAPLELPAPPARPVWLRPPGALPEAEFLSVCTRCTDCLEACPHQSIRRLGPELGVAAGTPAILPSESPCYLCEGLPCIAACVPRALRPVDRAQVRMGTAVLEPQKCLVAQGQRCDYCVTRCPLRGEAILWGAGHLPEIQETACAGCGVCAYLCPGGALAV